MLSSAGFRMTLQGQPQSTYVIQSSTDLRIWLPISTNTLQTSQMDITDPTPPARQKFYRAVLP